MGLIKVTALAGGHTLRDNLVKLIDRFHLTSSGYFGVRGQGGAGTRNIASNNPGRTAFEFQSIAGEDYVSFRQLPGKGHVLTMRDGSVITYRYISSSKNRSPVVELKVKGAYGVKSQKIHFVFEVK